MSNIPSLHEDPKKLSSAALDRHRAISSVMEELEAVDWYDQRAEAASDDDLRRILIHNRDEEKEHAAMVIEWLRRHDPVFERHLRTYLFTDRPIVALEAKDTGEAPSGNSDGPSLRIGSLRKDP